MASLCNSGRVFPGGFPCFDPCFIFTTIDICSVIDHTAESAWIKG